MTNMVHDVIVIGGGIVGLAVAKRLGELTPGADVVVLEKESGLGRHQTGHNSGVIHAGVYYPPGSFKAKLCIKGAEATKKLATERGIPWRQTGKMLVATREDELPRMEDLFARCAENGLEAHKVSAEELAEREPNVQGLGAFFVPSTGIIDYRQVCSALAEIIVEQGGTIETGAAVDSITETATEVTVTAGDRTWQAQRLVVCGGIQADRLAQMAGVDPEIMMMPFRGEYYRLASRHHDIVNHLIYPIPDPELPFLGVHLTPMIDGTVTVGPNAVLGLAREGYAKGSLNFGDIVDMARRPASWKVARANWRVGIQEMRNSLSKKGYLELCRRYAPSLEVDDLRPYPAGIRAQAVRPDGSFVHDFLFKNTDRMLHVLNAPSPAATSALPIGEYIVDELASLGEVKRT